MQSYYEITVSHEGRHLFATAPHSATTQAAYEALMSTIRAKFTVADGYRVEGIYWECAGHIVR